MTTFWVCPIDGTLPADAGSDTSKNNNVVLPQPVISSVTTAGTAGTTTYGYKVSAVVGGREGPASAEVTVTTGNATLNGTNYNVVSWGAATGATGYNVYGRTAGGENLLLSSAQTGTSYNDQGAAGTSATPPSATLAGTGDGHAPHCGLCGSALVLVDQTHVQTLTGVAAASQHPADIDAVYVVNSDNPEGQAHSTAYALTGRESVYPHSFSVTNRGTQSVTPETVNGTVGP